MRAPQARVTRKIARDSKFVSEAAGPLYSGNVRRGRTLFRDHEMVGVLSAGFCRAISRTRSVKTSSQSWTSNPHLRGCSRAYLYVRIVAGFLPTCWNWCVRNSNTLLSDIWVGFFFLMKSRNSFQVLSYWSEAFALLTPLLRWNRSDRSTFGENPHV